MELLRLENLEKILLLELISLDDINNQPQFELQTDDEQPQKLEDIMLLSCTNIAAQRQ